jgi:hypothetical protein
MCLRPRNQNPSLTFITLAARIINYAVAELKKLIMKYDLMVVGGGAAGFFAAINAAMLNQNLKVIILEKSKRVLQKVKISGGGRCNVTNVISTPRDLIKNYPRGENYLEDPFSRFTSTDTVKWFENQGIDLHAEKDGRVFPKTNSSQTIIDCFLDLCKKYQISVETSIEVKSFKKENNTWVIGTSDGILETKKLLLATGSSPAFWNKLTQSGFNVTSPVPSLFTFTLENKQISQLSGLSVPDAKVSISSSGESKNGPLLITHWGFSGPAILKLSSQSALRLNSLNYQFTLRVNWINQEQSDILLLLKMLAESDGKKNIITHNPMGLPTRLWKFLCDKAEIRQFQNWAECGKKHFKAISEILTDDKYQVTGKSTNKDEFVTAGGLDMEEINLSTYEHKQHNGLFFAGEILNIDGYTGGFNFQAAWTSGFLVAKAIKIDNLRDE